jgi:hypothetical protein
MISEDFRHNPRRGKIQQDDLSSEDKSFHEKRTSHHSVLIVGKPEAMGGRVLE